MEEGVFSNIHKKKISTNSILIPMLMTKWRQVIQSWLATLLLHINPKHLSSSVLAYYLTKKKNSTNGQGLLCIPPPASAMPASVPASSWVLDVKSDYFSIKMDQLLSVAKNHQSTLPTDKGVVDIHVPVHLPIFWGKQNSIHKPIKWFLAAEAAVTV